MRGIAKKAALAVIFVALIAAAVIAWFWMTQITTSKVTINLVHGSGSRILTVLYATTTPQQTVGLMNYTFNCSIGSQGCIVGELFNFSSEIPGANQTRLCFWMENTPSPLVQAWISKSGTVLFTYNATPQSTATVCNNGYSVLELASRYNISISAGDKVTIVGAPHT